MSERLATKGAVFVPCAKCRALTRVEIEVTSETVKQEKAEPKEEKKEKPAKDVKE